MRHWSDGRDAACGRDQSKFGRNWLPVFPLLMGSYLPQALLGSDAGRELLLVYDLVRSEIRRHT